MATSYTDAQKRAFAQQAKKEGREVAAKAAATSSNTIGTWAQKFGVELPGRGGAKAAASKKRTGKRRGKKKRRTATNGNARPRGIEAPSVGGLDAIRDQLLVALKGVEALRTSYRQVFG